MAGSNGVQIALGAAAAMVIVAAAVVLQPLVSRDVPVPDVVVAIAPDPVPQVTELQPEAEPENVPELAPEPISESAPELVAEPAPEPAPVAAPVIDLVRIEPDGSGIVAGQAQPGMAVAVMLGADPLAQAVADAAGRFVAFVALAPSDQPRLLSLVADPAGAAVVSDATVIVAPTVALAPLAEPEAVAVVAPEPAEIANPELAMTESRAEIPTETLAEIPVEIPDEKPTTVSPGPEILLTEAAEPAETDLTQAIPVGVAEGTESAPELTQAPAAAVSQATDDTTAPATPADPAPPVVETAPAISDSVTALQTPVPDAPAVAPVLLADASGVRILQPALAPGATPEVLATVALDAIAYDAAGEVQLSGRATGGGVVRVYVDNRPVIEVPVDASGQWTSGLPDVPTGVYTMRVDQIDAAGQVVSRIETPFLREERATIAQVMVDQTADPDFTVAVKIVQPGATLWAIARERYGDGVLYVQVFEANRDRIRNPDLIYPGQVFVLPEISTE